MNDKTLRILEYDKIINKLVNLAASELGKEMAAKAVPQRDFDKIKRLLKETSDGVGYIVRKGSPPLSGLHDIRGALKRAGIGGVLNPGELLKVADVLYACRNLKNYASEDNTSEGENVVRELISCLNTNKRLEDNIKNAIISEEEISDDATPELFSIRRKIREQQNAIKDKLNEIVKSSKYQKYMQEALVTMRGDRYVIPVKQEFRNEVPGLVHDMSASGATIFIEPMAIVEANNSIKQLKVKEQLEIERILAELTAQVKDMADALEANVSLLAKLDFIFAKAKLSVDYNCVCPELNNEKRIIIKRGRHPLLEKSKVVPIDLWIGEDFNTLVITGPNTGGKTVTLKTVGLFTLMTQAGLHIPASDGTEMAVFKNVFADIGDEQSIEQSLSTFSSHMKNIINILHKADENSLVLFDELGAGTDPTEGAALAMAILENLKQRDAITLATTHYSEIKAYAVSTKGVENACCEFDVETLKPTYKLLIGVPGKSNAFAISQKLGLSKQIINRAKEFLSQEDIKFEDMLLSIEKNKKQSEKEKMLAQSYRQEIERLKNELEEQKAKLDRQKDMILKEAKEKAKKIYADAKAEVEYMISEMKKLDMEREAVERSKAAEEIRMKLRNKVSSMEESLAEALMPKQRLVKPPENLKPGDTVVIINLDKKGEIVTPPDKDGEAVVQVGIMRINVHVSNLRIVEENNDGNKKTFNFYNLKKERNVGLELDLRGMTVDEAIERTDKYLDDAIMSGLSEVALIHGKGTGTLRNGIHQYLKTNRNVKSFRLGKAGEGDTGVTIVQLG